MTIGKGNRNWYRSYLIGKFYSDNTTCDVVDMYVSRILLKSLGNLTLMLNLEAKIIHIYLSGVHI